MILRFLSFLNFFKIIFQKSIILIGEKSLCIDEGIDALLQKDVIEELVSSSGTFICNFFLVPKPNGTYRMIIDLSHLNDFVERISFKMDLLQTALGMLVPGAYMASLDLKDAYYSLLIHKYFRKFLGFQWKGRFYQFLCLPFGITIAPRVFTKVLKPVVYVTRENLFNIVAIMYPQQ